ncbi:hypothetical protein [Enterococcus avium]|uniref:hypothetical protein n=1 Tax=Enterococcus avium TaxID=33945 RepID=UPI00288DF913|nr:hypothetical protein [Enterococcus avium]MDT2483135.1 hypothetical protein [Enterococcus avium]MDT2509691.1 hypothetical protein [Enterococcus avium]
MVELKTDFTRGQENAQDGLNKNFSEVKKFLNDLPGLALLLAKADFEGMRTFTINKENSSFFDQGQMVFQRVGLTVYVSGIFKTSKQIAEGVNILDKGVAFPEWLRTESQNRNFVCVYDSLSQNIYLEQSSNTIKVDGKAIPVAKWLLVSSSSYLVSKTAIDL